VVGSHPKDGIKYTKNVFEIFNNLNLEKETIRSLMHMGNSYLIISLEKENKSE